MPADNAAVEPALFDFETPMISLNAIAGIHKEDTMQLYITIGNEQLSPYSTRDPCTISSEVMWRVTSAFSSTHT